jgi:hypothetical protein
LAQEIVNALISNIKNEKEGKNRWEIITYALTAGQI